MIHPRHVSAPARVNRTMYANRAIFLLGGCLVGVAGVVMAIAAAWAEQGFVEPDTADALSPLH